MADNRTGPKVGDPARIDGMELAVFEVSERTVKFACPDRIACAGRVGKIRARYAEEGAALQARFDEATEAALAEAEAEGIDPKNLVKARRSVVKAEMDLHTAKLARELDAVPGGTIVGAAPKDVHWVAEHECWSVPGRFYAREGGRRPADPASLAKAAGR